MVKYIKQIWNLEIIMEKNLRKILIFTKKAIWKKIKKKKNGNFIK